MYTIRMFNCIAQGHLFNKHFQTLLQTIQIHISILFKITFYEN
jgi:hypothetical protein